MLIENYAPIVFAYIDPGTGSMLFTILVGLLSVATYGFKSLSLKMRSSLGFRKRDIEKHNFLIYTDSKRYWNVFRLICNEFEKREIELTYLTQSDDDPVFSEKYNFIKPKYIGDGQKGFTYLNYLNSDVFLSTTPSLDVFQWKRSKNTKYYIHIPHACSDITLYRLYGIDYYDAILLSGEFQVKQVREMEEKRNLPSKDLRIVGLTYFDELKSRLDKAENVKNEIPVVLLAPSWGSSSILNKYRSEFIDALIATGYKIIIRPHPQSYVSETDMINSLSAKYPEIEWNKDNDNFGVLNKADILISDFSGVIFDFALVFNKPIIYTDTEFDDSVYDAHWLDSKLWTFETLPKIGKKLMRSDFGDLKSMIDDCLNNTKFAEGRKKAINECWENIGCAAEAIVDYMIEKQKELTEEKKADEYF